MVLRKFLRKFDYFGYIPQFRINGDLVYNSAFGGIITILFIVFSIIYFVFQSIIFLNNWNKVTACMISSKPAETRYNLTTKDLYFGIGLINAYQKELNLEDFPYLDFNLNLVIIDEKSIRTKNKIVLERCNFSLLINQQDIENLNPREINLTKSRLPYYVCPVANSTFNFTPDVFREGHIYLDFTLTLLNNSFYSNASNDLNYKRPRLNLIYKQIGLNIENKSHPFVSYVENIFTNIDFDYVKKTEIGLYPVEILDNKNRFFSNSFESFKDSSNVSSLQNGTVFKFFRRSDFFERIWNRFIPLEANDNTPIKQLSKMLLRINPSTDVYLRDYKKFTSFLAEVSAILSNSLLFFVIVMSKVNEINGKHSLLKYMFSYEKINNMLKFNDDLNVKIQKQVTKRNIHKSEIINNNKIEIPQFVEELESSLIINKESKSIDIKKNILSSSLLKNDISLKFAQEKNDLKVSKSKNVFLLTEGFNTNEKIENPKNPTEHSSDESIPKFKLDVPNVKKSIQNFFLNTKLFDLYKDLSEERMKFKFSDYLKSFVLSNKEKKNKMYNLINDNLDDNLDIIKYLQLKQEVSLLKELLLDDKQLLIFNSFSQVINFKNIIQEVMKNEFNFKIYHKNDYKKLFGSIKYIFERHSENDIKILRFFNFTSQN